MPQRTPTFTPPHAAASRKAHAKAYERNRGSASQRGYDRRWRKYRQAYLHEHPLCVACKEEGRTTAATDLDHITPVNDGGDFWDPDNHQPLCHSCHSRKTAREKV